MQLIFLLPLLQLCRSVLVKYQIGQTLILWSTRNHQYQVVRRVILSRNTRSWGTLLYFPPQWYHLPPVWFLVGSRPELVRSSFSLSLLVPNDFNLLITLDSNKMSISSTYFWTWNVAYPSSLLSNSTLIISIILVKKKCWDLITFCMLVRSITWGEIPVTIRICDNPLPAWGTGHPIITSKGLRT